MSQINKQEEIKRYYVFSDGIFKLRMGENKLAKFKRKLENKGSSTCMTAVRKETQQKMRQITEDPMTGTVWEESMNAISKELYTFIENFEPKEE